MSDDWVSSLSSTEPHSDSFWKQIDSSIFTYEFAASHLNANLMANWAEPSTDPLDKYTFSLWFEGYSPKSASPTMRVAASDQPNLAMNDEKAEPTPGIVPDVWAPNSKMIIVNGITKGTNLSYKHSGETVFKPVPIRTPGEGVISYLDPQDIKRSLTIRVINPGPANDWQFALKAVGTGPSRTKISASFGGQFEAPMGGYTAGSRLVLPTGAQWRQAMQAAAWAAGISHIQGLVISAKIGTQNAVHAMVQNYAIWAAGKGLLPTLGAIVQNGSSYAKNTFWSALDRLNSAIRFRDIVQYIRAETNSKINPLMKQTVSFRGLTLGTAMFRQFIREHPEVNGNTPITVVKSDTKATYDKSFSIWVRETMISLNYTLTGKFSSIVKQSLKKAAIGSNLGFLIDGKNDAWDSSKGRLRPHARELSVEDLQIYGLPLLNVGMANQYRPQGNEPTAQQLIAQTRQNGMAGQLAQATRNLIFENGLDRTIRNPREIIAEAEYMFDIDHDTFVNFLAIPGVLLTGDYIDQNQQIRPLTQQQIYQMLFANNIHFQNDLMNYFGAPQLEENYNNMRSHFTAAHPDPDTPTLGNILADAIARGQILRAEILDPDESMRLINTLLVGNGAQQGTRFLENPWATLARHEVLNINETRLRLEINQTNATVRGFFNHRANIMMTMADVVPNCIP